jgi:hypothetical protein
MPQATSGPGSAVCERRLYCFGGWTTWNDLGHRADLPTLNGRASQDHERSRTVLNTQVTLGSGRASLFDKDGSAIVLHAKPDDYRSQPAATRATAWPARWSSVDRHADVERAGAIRRSE